jgi:hypothetical protein
MGRRSRIAVVAALLGAVVLAVALAPGIQESKLKRLLSEQREQAEHRAQLIRKFEAEQQPRFGRWSAVARPGADAAEQLAARGRTLDALIDAILRDARRRVRLGQLEPPPILTVECEPFPRTVYPTSSLNAGSSRIGSKSESLAASERDRSARSIASRRCSIASVLRPARLSQHATL